MYNRIKKIIQTLAPVVFVISAFCISSCGVNYLYRSQHSPTVSPDGKMLIFQSDHNVAGQYDCVIRFKTGTGWTPPVPLLLANTKFDTAGPFITYDQNYLLLTSEKPEGKGVDLWISKRGKAIWGKPVNLGLPINSTPYNGFGSISPDGRTLYFTRECQEKIGKDKFCLYLSTKNNDRWSEPVRIPAPVNSAYSDFAPIILADGRTMIFSSNRPGGQGGYDLYKTEHIGGAWSWPVNLGPAINTHYDERIVSIPASGDVIYYSRAQKVLGELVYRIDTAPIPLELRQKLVITVEGVVTDKKNPKTPISAEILITDTLGNNTRVVLSNHEDGKYFIVLNKDRVYDISVTKKGYVFYSARFDLRNTNRFDAIVRNIELSPIEAGSSVVLNNLFFKLNSDNVFDYEKSHYELERLAGLLRANPGMKIEIGGHTDASGTAEYNRTLSEKRARAVYDYLAGQGIQKTRLTVKGYGYSKPLSSSNPDQNRRVEVTILSLK